MEQIRYLIALLFKDMPKMVSLLFMFIVFLWSLYFVKKLEPMLFPVVKDFTIREVSTNPRFGTMYIRGSFVKVRNCRPLEVVGYHDDLLLIVDYHQKRPEISTRPLGLQYFDWWQIIPPVKYITLYVRHSCEFGTVMTKMFEGEVKAVPYEEGEHIPDYGDEGIDPNYRDSFLEPLY